eukprot:jgi/Chrzof1/8025/UNPLg00914.t1
MVVQAQPGTVSRRDQMYTSRCYKSQLRCTRCLLEALLSVRVFT